MTENKVDITCEVIRISEEDGESWLFLEPISKSVCKIFIYKNAKDGYISFLGVPDKSRKQGIGKFLLDRCCEIAKFLKLTEVYMNVKKDSWMHDWYARYGFADSDMIDDNYVEMTKTI